MEAIILAGGMGTRLRSVIQDLPKPMAPIGKRPFLDILLTKLKSKGFSRVVLSVGYKADAIKDHFGSHYKGMDLVYEIETTPLGTGGAVRAALSRCEQDHVFVFNGDTYLDLEIADAEALWSSLPRPVIVAREVADTARYGRLIVSDGCLSGFSEKGVTGRGLINAGCYILPVDILNDFPIGQPFSLETDFLANAVGSHHFQVFVTQGDFIDIGIPEDYARAQIDLAEIDQ